MALTAHGCVTATTEPYFPFLQACSSRSTPKPRPPSPTTRPNITFQTYACPEAYAKWYCLNGATCFSVRIGESILYNCECADGFMGQRCEFKDLDGSYLPSREKVLIETASVSNGFMVAFLLIVFISIIFYTYLSHKSESLKTWNIPDSSESQRRETALLGCVKIVSNTAQKVSDPGERIQKFGELFRRSFVINLLSKLSLKKNSNALENIVVVQSVEASLPKNSTSREVDINNRSVTLAAGSSSENQLIVGCNTHTSRYERCDECNCNCYHSPELVLNTQHLTALHNCNSTSSQCCDGLILSNSQNLIPRSQQPLLTK
ncbi:Protein spitz-like protein [Dinothrombium tinctorium]|uniref:Protein spitz-like protein n=1 Tax=Dinothrombium tinctorium TaxID=1965070 RepID=A0A443RQG6_9ACAR|nr:Protein spitz-like protein [Dinothrombium tinctorium]